MPPISQETLAILGLGVGLFVAFRSLRADLRAAAVDRAGIRSDIHALAERVARIEGALPFLTDHAAKPSEPVR